MDAGGRSFPRSVFAAALLCAAPVAAQSTTRASVDSNGLEHHGICSTSSISADGRFVAFTSNAGDLVPGDTNGREDVFVRDRLLGLTTRVSVSSTGAQGSDKSNSPSISADGRYVAFTSWAANLVAGDGNGESDVFLHDRQTLETVRVSVGLGGAEPTGWSWRPAISADGNHVAFVSEASNLVPGDVAWADAFVHDRLAGWTTRVSVSSSGVAADRDVHWVAISGEGRRIAFTTRATNLVPPDFDGHVDAFVHDRQTGQTVLASVSSAGTGGDGECQEQVAISADGSCVAFGSVSADLVPGDTNQAEDVFVHDLLTGETTRVSVSSAGSEARTFSISPGLSATGRHAVFVSRAGDLVAGDTNGMYDVFLHDRATGQTSRMSVTSAFEEANRESELPAISADGEFVCFLSGATNLVPGDTNSRADVFVHERIARMEATGGCRGRVDVVIRDATPWGRLAFFYGPAGSHVLTTGPCAGLVLDVAPPVLGAVLVADEAGSASWGLRVPVNVCGQSLQAVDVDACDVTLPVVLRERLLGLTRQGLCPAQSTIELRVADALPGSQVALLHGAAGSYLMPRDPCRGVLLGLGRPSLLAVVQTDGAGRATYSFAPPPALCGMTAQAVEMATCILSNTVAL